MRFWTVACLLAGAVGCGAGEEPRQVICWSGGVEVYRGEGLPGINNQGGGWAEWEEPSGRNVLTSADCLITWRAAP